MDFEDIYDVPPYNMGSLTQSQISLLSNEFGDLNKVFQTGTIDDIKHAIQYDLIDDIYNANYEEIIIEKILLYGFYYHFENAVYLLDCIKNRIDYTTYKKYICLMCHAIYHMHLCQIDGNFDSQHQLCDNNACKECVLVKLFSKQYGLNYSIIVNSDYGVVMWRNADMNELPISI